MNAYVRRLVGLIGVVTLSMLFSACSNSGKPPDPGTNPNQSPVASFTATPSSGTPPLAVTFNGGASSDPDGTITTYAWDFGDNSSGTGVAVQHSYAAAGTYTARLAVTDNAGATGSATQQIQVTAPPPANQSPNALFTATPISGVAPLMVSFDAVGSTDPDGTIANFIWDFGDNSSGTGATPQHTYPTVGTYTARLTVTDNQGATGTMTRDIQVSAQLAPVALFSVTPNSGPAPLTNFDASTSSDPDGGTLNYAWDFGDSTTGAGSNTAHLYAASGLYTATLTVTDDEGSTASSTQVISASGFTNTANVKSPLGTNFSGVLYFSGDYPFVNLFKAAQRWSSGSTVPPFGPDARVVDVDENGWVRSLAQNQQASAAFFVNNQHNDKLANEEFIVRYDGTGTMNYVNVTILSRAAGRDHVRFTGATGGFHVQITATTPGNYIRNIRVVPTGGICLDNPLQRVADAGACAANTYRSFEDNSEQIMFHPVFLDRIKTYASHRFMNWGKTNSSTVSNWNERATPTDAVWSYRGVPIEVMVQLANLMDADPWICIPHLADDDYIRNAARLIRDQLEPGRRAYIEYSNEVWNTAPDFQQTFYAINQSRALGLDQTPNGPDTNTGVLRFYSRRSRQMFEIFEQEFGTQLPRVIRVAAGQPGSAFNVNTILNFENAEAHTDAFAIAPYFGRVVPSGQGPVTGQQQVDFFKNLGVDGVFTWLQTNNQPNLPTGSLQQNRTMVNATATAVANHGKVLLAYEGGQHFVGGNSNGVDFTLDQDLNAMFFAINRDARMGNMYTQYLDNWKAEGGGMFMHFVNIEGYGRFGSWGALEYPTQSGSPKFDALQTWIANNLRP